MSFMAGFNLPFKFPFKKAQNISGVDPSIKSTQPAVLKSSAPPQPKSKSLAELEKEAQAKYYATYPHKQPVSTKAKRGVLSKIIWTAILLGVPVGVVWGANLPYSVIRRPVARTAPILLLPSYMSLTSSTSKSCDYGGGFPSSLTGLPGSTSDLTRTSFLIRAAGHLILRRNFPRAPR